MAVAPSPPLLPHRRSSLTADFQRKETPLGLATQSAHSVSILILFLMLRKETENCDCLQGKGIQERFQFMVMLLPKPLYIGIDFSCCSRGFLVISISKPAFDTERSQFGSCEISPIQSLIGLTGRRWVMGVVC
ncbi:unnamed protein product [Camellia sinensis]